MGTIIISSKKKDKMSDLVEDMLYAGGKLMHCLEELSDESEMGERSAGRMGYRDGMGMRDGGRMGSRSGYRHDEGWDDYDGYDMGGERRGRRRY